MKAVCCTVVVLTSMFAFSANQTSGALLTITSSDNSVNLKIYDSQIHTGTVRTVPTNGQDGNSNCQAVDQIKTDAYVLQGGSPDGCDPGDPFETSNSNGTASLGGFTVTTTYTNVNGTCNTNGNICVNGGSVPDTGFLTVSNTTGSPFTGTISLTGVSNIQGGSSCPANGIASDSVTRTLNNGDTVTLALSNDSSNCGGWNQSQQLTLGAPGSATNPIVFKAGNETLTIAGANNTGGEVITYLPTPVQSNSFNSGTLFLGDVCDVHKEFSAALAAPAVLNCVESFLDCTGAADCNSYNYQISEFFDPVPDPPHGTPLLLKADGATCPSSAFDQNILLDYTVIAQIRKTGGSGGHSCFVSANDNGQSLLFTPGNYSVGSYASNFFLPIFGPPTINKSKAGSANPVIWQAYDSNNNLVTNPNFYTGGFCPNLTNCQPNSVGLRYVAVTSCNPFGGRLTTTINTVGFTIQFNPVNDTFQLNGKSPSALAGQCAVLELVFIGSSTGLAGVPPLQSLRSAFFQFK